VFANELFNAEVLLNIAGCKMAFWTTQGSATLVSE